MLGIHDLLTAWKKKASKGLTLIEMMIVIAIIGLIAALVINRYTHALQVGQAGGTEMELKQIATALDVYNTDKSSYPASGTVAPALFGGAGNQYMGNTPTDGGASYTYTAPTGGGDYTVCSGRSVDGSAVPSLKTTAGGATVAGTAYNVCYSPTYGEYVQAAGAP